MASQGMQNGSQIHIIPEDASNGSLREGFLQEWHRRLPGYKMPAILIFLQTPGPVAAHNSDTLVPLLQTYNSFILVTATSQPNTTTPDWLPASHRHRVVIHVTVVVRQGKLITAHYKTKEAFSKMKTKCKIIKERTRQTSVDPESNKNESVQAESDHDENDHETDQTNGIIKKYRFPANRINRMEFSDGMITVEIRKKADSSPNTAVTAQTTESDIKQREQILNRFMSQREEVEKYKDDISHADEHKENSPSENIDPKVEIMTQDIEPEEHLNDDDREGEELSKEINHEADIPDIKPNEISNPNTAPEQVEEKSLDAKSPELGETVKLQDDKNSKKEEKHDVKERTSPRASKIPSYWQTPAGQRFREGARDNAPGRRWRSDSHLYVPNTDQDIKQSRVSRKATYRVKRP